MSFLGELWDNTAGGLLWKPLKKATGLTDAQMIGIGAMAVDSALSPQRDKYIGNDPYYTEAMNKEAGALKTVGLAAAGFAAPYIASAHFQNKVERGEPVGMIGRAVANNPAKLGIVGAAGMLNPRAFYQGTKTVLRDAAHGVKGLLS